MHLIDRNAGSPAGGEPTVPAHIAAALRNAYLGNPTAEEMTEAIEAVRTARTSRKWFACDCRSEEGVYPLIAPAYLTSAKTYYLRRLAGPRRPLHAVTCPFYRDRGEKGLGPLPGRRIPVQAPVGFFSVIEQDSTRKVAAAGDRLSSIPAERSYSPSPLARQLLRLVRLAGLNRLPPVQSSQPSSIAGEFGRLRAAAENILVSKNIPLARVLATHPDAYLTNRLFAQIRRAQAGSPSEPPQGFLLLYASRLSPHIVHAASKADIEIAGGIASPPGVSLAEDGPFLVLGVVGDYAGAKGLAALRAYAQPIYSANQFIPVSGDFQRSLLRSVNSLRWALSHRRPELRISLEIPLFDMHTREGPVRPDLAAEVISTETGEVRTCYLIDSNRSEDDAPGASALSEFGPIYAVSKEDLLDKDALERRLNSAFSLTDQD